MGKLIQFPRRRRRHPVAWAWREANVTCEAIGSAFFLPGLFLMLLTVALLARVPLRWQVFELARLLVEEVA